MLSRRGDFGFRRGGELAWAPAKNGGEGGIRTPEASYPHLHDFQSCSLSQLGHLSAEAPESKLREYSKAL